MTGFQHTAARRRLQTVDGTFTAIMAFQHTAARRRLPAGIVSVKTPLNGFNTQPPEGGCDENGVNLFNAEVSTHSRPKAAAANSVYGHGKDLVSTHSRPKAAA